MSDNRTTELREKLTERGVKWWPMRNNGYYEERDTEFVANGKKHIAHEWGDGLAIYNLTPEQAIAATLGKPEIVRCRDCKYMHTVRDWLGMDVDECWLHADRESGALGKERTEPDGFCKWGERRER